MTEHLRIILENGLLKENLETLFKNLNKREYVNPDPLIFLYDYKDLKDREIVGLISSSLAYGNVKQIIKSINNVLTILGPSPTDYLLDTNIEELTKIFKSFKHRFTTGEELADFLNCIKLVICKYETLYNCFLSGFNQNDENIMTGLINFTKELTSYSNRSKSSLVPDPKRGSAVKRLNLYLRWMVRNDEVDPGGWEDIPKSKLIIPLDTHMHNICTTLGFTHRKSADLKSAHEITNIFKQLSPDDPVKYDFCLTRLGIRDDMDLGHFLSKCRIPI